MPNGKKSLAGGTRRIHEVQQSNRISSSKKESTNDDVCKDGERHEREADFDSPGSPLILVSETDNAAVAQFREYAISMLFVTAMLWGVKLTTSVGHYV